MLARSDSSMISHPARFITTNLSVQFALTSQRRNRRKLSGLRRSIQFDEWRHRAAKAAKEAQGMFSDVIANAIFEIEEWQKREDHSEEETAVIESLKAHMSAVMEAWDIEGVAPPDV